MSSTSPSSAQAGPSGSNASGSGSTSAAHASVLTPSEALPSDSVHVKGPDMSRPLDLQALLESYERTGFQATALGKAVKIVEEMVSLLRHLQCRAERRSGNAEKTPTSHSRSSWATPPI